MAFDRPRRRLSFARLKNAAETKRASTSADHTGRTPCPITPAMLSGLASSRCWRSAASASRRPARRPIRCPILIARSRTGERCRPAGPGARPARSRSIPTAPASGSPSAAANPGRRREIDPGAAVRLRRLEARSDPQVRCLRQAVEELRRRPAAVPARHSRRPRRQRLGDRRPRPRRQGPPGVQVQPRRQAAADARQGRTRRAADRTSSTRRPPSSIAPNGDIFVADGHGGNTNARIVKFAKDGKFIKTWGKKGSAPGELDIPHAHRHGFARPAVRRRPPEQPHPDFRSGRKIPRSMGAVQPAERHLHRQARTTSTWRISKSESVSKNHDGWKRGIRDRQRQGRLGDGVHSRSRWTRPPARARPRASRRTRWATSTAPRSARSG